MADELHLRARAQKQDTLEVEAVIANLKTKKTELDQQIETA